TGAPSATGNQCLQTQSSATQLTFGACGAGTVTGGDTNKIVLNAEYVGAALDSASDSSCLSSNVGTMTSGYTGGTPGQNYYNWTTSTGSSECYDVVVQIPIPSDWSSWSGTPTITYAGSASGSTLLAEAYSCSGTETNYSTYESVASGTVGTFSSGLPTALTSENLPAFTSSSYSCGYLTLKLRMTANNTDTAIGTITIPYTSSTSNN
ncbi:MAG TPA: hypothetical protein VGF75_02430, partial [Candidatus Saccharimonadales bacterium]